MARRKGRRAHLWAAAALAAMVLAPAAAGPALAGPEPVSEGSTADNAQRKAAWAPDGTLYVTYVQPVDGVLQVFVKHTRNGGGNWTTLPQVSTNESFRPCVAVGQDGTLHVAWSEFVDGVRQVFAARWEGGPSWVDRQQVSFTPGYSGFPALALDQQETLHLVWYGYDGQTYRIHYRERPTGGNWSGTAVISRGVSDANSPAMGVEPDGSVHVAFWASVQGVAQVWYLHRGQDGWEAPEQVSPRDEQSLRPSLAVFPSGVPAVAYVVTGHGAPQVVYTQRTGAAAWAPWTALSQVAEGGDNPTLALGGEGQGAAFFETADGKLRSASMEGGRWAAARAVPGHPDGHWPSASWAMWPPSVASRAIFVVWTEGGAPGAYRLAWEQFAAFERPPPPPPAAQPLGLEPALLAAAATAAVLASAFVAFRARRRSGDPPR